MIEKNLDLIRNIAWSYHRMAPAFEFDDLFGEGCVAYLEAELSYDPGSTMKEITYIWTYIQQHLNNYVQRSTLQRTSTNNALQWANPVVFEDIDLYITASNYEFEPEKALLAKEAYRALVDSLSPLAQELVGYILDGAGGYLPIDRPKLCRGALKDTLREKGWSWPMIWNTFREVKTALAWQGGKP